MITIVQVRNGFIKRSDVTFFGLAATHRHIVTIERCQLLYLMDCASYEPEMEFLGARTGEK